MSESQGTQDFYTVAKNATGNNRTKETMAKKMTDKQSTNDKGTDNNNRNTNEDGNDNRQQEHVTHNGEHDDSVRNCMNDKGEG